MNSKIIEEDLQYMFEKASFDWHIINGKTFLVTGAYGMLTSYMVYMLIYLNEKYNAGIKIIAVGRDYRKYQKRFNSYANREYMEFYQSDLSKPLSIEGDIDYIVHGASPASSQYYDVNPVGVLNPNVLGTYYTLELAKEKNVDGYLYFSSGEIYGNLVKEYIKEEDMGVLNPAEVRSCYGEAKRVGETMCKCYQHQYGIKTNMVRPCHTYGPTMDIDNDSRVFASFVSDIVNNRNIVMRSDGSATRIFCYIADAVLGYFTILLNGKPGEPYNVANEEGRISIKDLASMLCELFPEKKLSVEIQGQSTNYLENAHKVHSNYSTQKLETLGWKPSFSLQDGFSRTIKSFNHG